MVLLYNSFITDVPGSGTQWKDHKIFYDRGNLKDYNKIEVLKYSLSTISKAYPWERVIILIELEGEYNTKSNKEHLLDFIFQEFKGAEIYFSSKRNIFQEDWIKTYELINDDFIFYMNAHDHIFIDSSKDYLKELEEKVKIDGDYEYKTICMSHWCENIRSAKCGYINPYWVNFDENGRPKKGVKTTSKYNQFHPTKWNKDYKATKDFIFYKGELFDSFNIITKKTYENWFLQGKWDEEVLPLIPNSLYYYPLGKIEMSRTEGTGFMGIGDLKRHMLKSPAPLQQIYVPYREIFRHFDGYYHQRITNDKCPAIDIPLGYFDKKIKIRYGYNDRKEDWVNINPQNPYYYAHNKLGTDYKFTLNDLPYAWKDRIIEIDINPDVLEEDIIKGRIDSVVQMLFNDPRYSPYIDIDVKDNVLKHYFNKISQELLKEIKLENY